MDQKKIVNLIRQFLEEKSIEIEKIYLFGSRSRSDYKPDSDYDILIVLKNNILSREKRKLSLEIRKFLIRKNVPFNIDLIIKNYENWEWESQNLGFLSYTVKNEGINV